MGTFFTRSHLADLWQRTRDSFWLVPALMLAAAIGLAYGLVQLDFQLWTSGAYDTSKSKTLWIISMEGVGARAILSTLAGSMATIAGVVFSITIVALQLASSQFGPHVLRSFLRDRGNQVSLGTFVSCFLYPLLVILAVREQSGFVPLIATYFAILTGVAAMGVLVYFIHHVSNFIRLESITAALFTDIEEATATAFPEELGHGEKVAREMPPSRPKGFAAEAGAVRADCHGYIRRLDEATLMRIAEAEDLRIWLAARPGDFIVAGAMVMEAAPAARVTRDVAARLRRTIVLGGRRTPRQDIAYALQQLCEVAVRALSPGINAPFTALPCIDLLAAGLCRIADRRMPSLARRDRRGAVRVLVARGVTLPDLTRVALNPIATAGSGYAVIMSRLVKATALIASRSRSDEDAAEIRDLGRIFVREAEKALANDRERDAVRRAAGEAGPDLGLIT